MDRARQRADYTGLVPKGLLSFGGIQGGLKANPFGETHWKSSMAYAQRRCSPTVKMMIFTGAEWISSLSVLALATGKPSTMWLPSPLQHMKSANIVESQ